MRAMTVTDRQVLTKQFAIAAVDGEVSQGTRHCPNYTVVAMSRKLCHHGKTLLQTHCGTYISTILKKEPKKGGVGLFQKRQSVRYS